MARCPTLLQCPVCTQPLAVQPNVYRCPDGHSFDIARQGYVNLLPGSGPRPAIQGDAREMLQARREFLEAGFYQPLSDYLNRLVGTAVEELAKPRECITVLDAGCGEGYYLGRLHRFLERNRRGRPICLFGMDLAKDAVRLAAGRHKGITFFVADTYERLLLPSGVIDVLLNLFAPRHPAEFRRVLNGNGGMFIVIPGPKHLSILRKRFSLLQIEEEKEAKVVDQMDSVFTLARRTPLEFEATLGGEELAALLRMTPNYWHLQDAVRQGVVEMAPETLPFSSIILEFRPK